MNKNRTESKFADIVFPVLERIVKTRGGLQIHIVKSRPRPSVIEPAIPGRVLFQCGIFWLDRHQWGYAYPDCPAGRDTACPACESGRCVRRVSICTHKGLIVEEHDVSAAELS